MFNDILSRSRSEILNSHGSELHALSEPNGLDSLMQKRQEIIVKMNEARKRAIEEAEEPFKEELEQLDIQYATLLRFVGDNGEST